MGSATIPEDDEAREARIEARAEHVRRLCKGHGIGYYREDDSVPLDLFGVSNSHGLVAVMRMATRFLPHSLEPVQAIRNALDLEGGDIGRSNLFQEEDALLKNRRQRFAAQKGISTRTVMRLEAQGARAVSEFIEEFCYDEPPMVLVHVGLSFSVMHSTKTAEFYDRHKLAEAMRLIDEASED